MALVTVVFVGGLLVATALCVLAFCCAVKRQQREMALHAPLLDSDAPSRVLVALRDAQEQPTVCAVCAFENAPRHSHCSLCGSTLTPAAEATARASSSLLAFLRSLACCRSVTVESSSVRSQPDVFGWGTQLTKRQQRARKRKEWTREIRSGSDGRERLVWRQQPPAELDGSEPSTMAGLAPACGYVVLFNASDESRLPHVANTERDEDEDGMYLDILDDGYTSLDEICIAESGPSSEKEGSSETLERAGAADATSTSSMQLVAVGNGDAVTMECTSAEAFASTSALEFPAKYAHFVTTASALLGEAAEHPRVSLKVSRSKAYEESMAILSHLPTESVRAPMSVQFEGESGVDAGGLFRDWLTLMSSGLVASAGASSSAFVATDTPDETFHLRSLGSSSNGDVEAMDEALAAGRFIGRALLEGFPIGFHLSLPLLKMVLGVPVSLDDLEFLDCESHRSLVWLLENDGVDALSLDFTVTETLESGEVATIALVPGGEDVAVTDANKREFVALKFRHAVFSRVRSVLSPFLQGVHEVVPMELLAIFDPEELDYVLSGSDEVDVADWRRHTKYTAELQGHVAMRWFWELVAEMPNEYRRRLLRFSTGSSRVPIGGFAALTSYDGRVSPFTLKGVSWIGSGGYIRSHACFNRLDLPLYVDRDDLKQMLWTILESEDAAGFTMA